MKRINSKTVDTRLSFAATFSSPHPFVAFVLSESLGTRLSSALHALAFNYCVIAKFGHNIDTSPYDNTVYSVVFG